MLKVRLKSLGKDQPLQTEISDGESLLSVSKRLLEGTPYRGDPQDAFGAMLNGMKVVNPEWDKVILRKTDIVVMAPALKGDNQVLRIAAVIAIAVASHGAAGALGFTAGTWSHVAFTVGANLAANMALNSVFPPPNPSGLGDDKTVKESQMYVLTGQSNNANKMGPVPRVYGTHRLFPTIAANPYTAFEADINGKLISYLYAIYDVGYGPLLISDIRIGDTPLGDFDNVDVRLVDLNKPDTSEGVWDDQLDKEFKYYKGDVHVENVAVVFEKNQTDNPTPPEGDWRAVRSTATNPGNNSAEISVFLTAPRGLIAYNNAGEESERRVFFNLEFALEGTEDWKPFNDLQYVHDFRSSGGGLTYSDIPLKFDFQTLTDLGYRTMARLGGYSYGTTYNSIIGDAYGYPKGTTYVDLKTDPDLQVGSTIRCGGEVVGLVDSFTAIGGGNSRYMLEVPTTRVFLVAVLYTKTERKNSDNSIVSQTKRFSPENPIMRGIPALTRVVMRSKSTEPLYATYKFWPKQPGQYKVRVTRVQSSSTYSKTIVDTITWSALETRYNIAPIKTPNRHVFLELKIKATNQLSGSIDNLSVLAQSVLDVYEGGQWVKKPTNNPAWIYADLITGSVNKRAVPKSRLHVDSLVEWAEFCDEVPPSYDTTLLRWVMPRFECNFVMDFSNTLQQIAEKVTAVGHAHLSIIDGNYGVMIDKRRNIPVQIFTPRNSSNFQSSRTYPIYPDAISMQYVDPNINWDMNSVEVYVGTHDETTAVNIEETATFGITNFEQAWREGAYTLAVGKLRQENVTIDVDYEGLICVPGDYVQYAQDAMRMGGKGSRVVGIVGNEVTLDDSYDNIAGTWGYVFRNLNGQIFKGEATPVDADTFILEGPELPEPGDLIIIGETDRVVGDFIVKAVTPKDDFAATLNLVEKADAIHDAETGQGVPDYDPQLSKVRDSDFVPPAVVEDFVIADSGYECANGNYQFYAVIDWEPPTGSAWELFEVYVNFGDGYSLVTQTRESIYKYLVDTANIGKEHSFKVLAVSTSGLKLNLISAPTVSYTPVKKTTPPSDVEFFSSDVTNEVLELSWTRIQDCDVARYQIRYSPITNGGAWESSTLLPPAAANQGSMSVQARTGTYFIKAIDYNGNESAKAAMVITTIPNLFGLNLIQTISDTPAFNGPMEKVEKIGDGVILQKEVQGGLDDYSYYSEGYYYYREIIDLGDIYTVRIEANVQAVGYSENDLIINWVPIASADPLVRMRNSDWDVEVQYRVSDKRNVMADWDLLMNIDPISEGVQANFSEWRKFTQGDITGRVIQFRLKLISLKPNVTPRVFDGTIRATMPNRTRRFDNIIAPDTGIELVYNPPFKGPGTTPNIQITIDDAEAGDHWVFEERTLEGFRIRFYDGTGTPVSRQFDAQVVGYGYKNPSII